LPRAFFEKVKKIGRFYYKSLYKKQEISRKKARGGGKSPPARAHSLSESKNQTILIFERIKNRYFV